MPEPEPSSASAPPPPPLGVLREVPPSESTSLCKLCFEPAQPDALGPLYELSERDETIQDDDEDEDATITYRAHSFCLLFSSGLSQGGEEDEGILGFLPPDILREWRRGQRLKCAFCQKKYATVGCSGKMCRKTYHVPCARKNGCRLQFCDDFSTFCKEHRPRQKQTFSKDATLVPCGVCLDDLDGENTDEGDEDQRLWAPCCGGWFHRPCLEHLAKSTGYFFKCPLCNNKEEFEREMKLFGVFVPEQDASWERDESDGANDAGGGGGNLDDDLLERHGHCDAEECVCPRGRTEDVDYTEWEIILCNCCGAQGIHVTCGQMPANQASYKWICPGCKVVLKKLPPKLNNVYKKVADDDQRKYYNGHVLLGQTFIVGGAGAAETLTVRHKEFEVTALTAPGSLQRPTATPTPTAPCSLDKKSEKVEEATGEDDKEEEEEEEIMTVEVEEVEGKEEQDSDSDEVTFKENHVESMSSEEASDFNSTAEEIEEKKEEDAVVTKAVQEASPITGTTSEKEEKVEVKKRKKRKRKLDPKQKTILQFFKQPVAAETAKKEVAEKVEKKQKGKKKRKREEIEGAQEKKEEDVNGCEEKAAKRRKEDKEETDWKGKEKKRVPKPKKQLKNVTAEEVQKKQKKGKKAGKKTPLKVKLKTGTKSKLSD